MVCRARFRRLSPPRLSLCRTVLPLETGKGFTPASEAKAASLRTLPGCDHTVRTVATETAPAPLISNSGAAGLCWISSVMRFWFAASCALTSTTRRANRTASSRAIDSSSGSCRPRHLAIAVICAGTNALRASNPRSCARSSASSALTFKVLSRVNWSRAALRTLSPARIPSSRRGTRSWDSSKPRTAVPIAEASRGSGKTLTV